MTPTGDVKLGTGLRARRRGGNARL